LSQLPDPGNPAEVARAALGGIMMYIDAINEYRVLYNIRKNKEEAFKAIEKEFGKKAVSEVQDLEVRLRKERKELQKDFDSDRGQTRKEWLIIGLLGLLIYAVLKMTKVW